MSQKSPPFRVFFWYFATEYMLIKPKGFPLLHFLALCDIFWKKKIKKFKFFFKSYLSLRYSADFRRYRLVPNWTASVLYFDEGYKLKTRISAFPKQVLPKRRLSKQSVLNVRFNWFPDLLGHFSCDFSFTGSFLFSPTTKIFGSVFP